MMETMALLPGIRLHCYRDNRFKQGCLSIQFLRKMSGGEAALNALLPSVLLRGTTRHPDLRAITLALDDLYGAAVSPLVRRVGDCQTTGLYCSMMDDRFALPGDRVLEPMLAFLEELLLEPLTEGDAFLPEFVESEKVNLISAIESELNDKRTYAMGKLLKLLCRNDSYGLSRMGEPEQVAAIEPGALYRHYQTVLRTSPVELIYVGSAEPETVAGLLRPMFLRLDRCPEAPPPQTDLAPAGPEDDTEELEVSQGKLCMGFTTPITNRRKEFAAMQIMNTVFGSGMTSKLFRVVRERLSLCYSIGSGYYGSKGVILVSAGIDFDKEQHVRREVLNQLDACRRGDISPEELTAAREALISGLRSTHDSPGAIESYYSSALIGGLRMTPEEYIRALEAVTPEDVVAAAGTVELHSSYFLKGVSQ